MGLRNIYDRRSVVDLEANRKGFNKGDTMSDAINPKNYKHLPVEAIDIIMAAIAKAPSNESAYLQGQVLKYLLRCWEKKGIEDLRKAKWYLGRLVDSFDETITEASGAIETSSDEPTPWTPKIGERVRIQFIDGIYVVNGKEPGYIDCYSVQLDGFSSRRCRTVDAKNLIPLEQPPGPPKRYRDPTQADLQSGPVCCEVRDWDSEQWKARQLIQVHESGPFRFLCKNETCDNPLNWNQCRIEVTE